jgi:hypothetical protein
MKISALILPAINGVLWGSFAWFGHEGSRSVEARVGHSNLGQVEFYVVLPLVMLIVAMVPAVLLSQTKWSTIGNVWSIFTLVLLIPYLSGYSGGI